MKKLPANAPQLQFLHRLPYFKFHLGDPGAGSVALPVRELFVGSFEKYLALESRMETEPRVPRCTPNQGSFSLEQIELLLPILRDFTPSGRVLSFYHPFYLARLEDAYTPQGHGYLSDLGELPQIVAMPLNDFSPTIWWAEDRSWFFLNDYDRTCAVFGGRATLSDTFLDCLPFRTYELSPATLLEDVDAAIWSSVGTIEKEIFG